MEAQPERALGHTASVRQLVPRAGAGRLRLFGYSRTQGHSPSFFLGALGALGGSSCSWYFLWEAVCECEMQG